MEELIGIPSTTIKACVFPPSELLPRITILDEDPKDPDWETCKPATFPEREFARLLSFIVFTLSPDISETAYPKDFFSLDIPRAVTTTSSNKTSGVN